jgi:hypothetical protein
MRKPPVLKNGRKYEAVLVNDRYSVITTIVVMSVLFAITVFVEL